MAERQEQRSGSNRAGETPQAAKLRLLELGEDDRRLLAELSDVLSPHLDGILERWHEYLLSHPETQTFLVRDGVSKHLLTALAEHFRSALIGPYDHEFFEERRRVGLVHARVELNPDLYLAAYRKIYDLVREFLLDRPSERVRGGVWLGAFQKVMFLDMEVTLDAYFEASTEKIVEASAQLRGLARELEVRNREVARQYEQSQEAARIKEEFLSRVSHELRTPLNAIVGYSDLLIDGVDGEVNEEQLRSLTRIRIKGQELAGMIERVIDTAKSAATVIDLRPTDVGSIVNRLAISIEERAAEKGLAVETRVDAGLPPVMADEQGLRTALGQLLDNALKFTSAGVIRLEAVNLGASVRLIVSDSGPGIPYEHREKVFAPFHQVEFGDTRATTGLGMGLSIALRAVERMGGTLQLVSSGPEGSSFAVELSAAEGRAYDI